MKEHPARSSLGDSLVNLAWSVGKLAGLETTLARTEMARKVTLTGKDALYIGIGGAAGYAGFVVLLSAGVDLLSARLPRWLASLLVSSAVAGAGGLLVQKGVTGLKHRNLLPNQTVETLKDSAETVFDQLR